MLKLPNPLTIFSPHQRNNQLISVFMISVNSNQYILLLAQTSSLDLRLSFLLLSITHQQISLDLSLKYLQYLVVYELIPYYHLPHELWQQPSY